MNAFNLTRLFKICIFVTLACLTRAYAQVPYQDLTHDSKVFGHKKNYRLYLPSGYAQATKRYPVIYFFHGWGGRHSSDDNAKLEYAMLQRLVDKYQTIMVMWDGNMEEAQPRPYNVGNHEDIKFQVQMKDYFPELVDHVDQTYRTLTDRDNRGIIGFSMGGFMSLFLSGKYPDKVCAGVSMMGSPEFFVGTSDNHTLYPVRYTFANLQDVKMRIHTSPTDILYFLNQEVKAGSAWEGKKIEMEEFPGGHMVDDPGQTARFEKAMAFVARELGKKHPQPKKWSHYDLYGDFGLWGYEVKSDKQQPGFIYLKDVTPQGFGVYTQKWLPHGPTVPVRNIEVQTAPVYRASADYKLVNYSFRSGKVSVSDVKADASGRIRLDFDAYGNETGIYRAADKASWGFLDFQVNGKPWVKNSGNALKIRLFNRGSEGGGNLKVVLSSPDQDIVIKDSVKTVQVNANARLFQVPDFELICNKKPPLHAEPADIKLRITVYDGNMVNSTVINVPVDFDVPYFTNIRIDDGKVVREAALGKGNGDGKVNAGEDIVLYEGGKRLKINISNVGIDASREQFTDEMIPARWPDGFTQQSIMHIETDAKEIECLASYETKTFNPIERKVTWGRVRLRVEK
ncbi:Enterochelin esterase [Dyadobacter sp. SG02]|uniref:alpha/beta hydrolase n=1 Tax=Dyadobacter sp. SG02 TaxID=1855291 RepID=UPI0008C307F1|nr:alpha/beta fold hydrolase [Dyadobacter sp. SG02]SEJ20968.1 Enterochelin esterase [Dyadobacter sp. SG02]